jgi:hypothetical protein
LQDTVGRNWEFPLPQHGLREIIEIAAEMVVGRQIKRLRLLPAWRTIARVSLTLAAQQFSPKIAMRQSNGVFIVVTSVPVAPFSNSISADVVSPVSSLRARAFDKALMRFIGPTHVTKAIEHVDAHACHAAGPAFFLYEGASCRPDSSQASRAVVAFSMHDGAEGALLLEVGEDAHRRHQPEVMPDSRSRCRRAAGIERCAAHRPC